MMQLIPEVVQKNWGRDGAQRLDHSLLIRKGGPCWVVCGAMGSPLHKSMVLLLKIAVVTWENILGEGTSWHLKSMRNKTTRTMGLAGYYKVALMSYSTILSI